MRRGWENPGNHSQRQVKLHEPLPTAVAEVVAAKGVEPRLTVPADIDAAGRLGQRWLVADPERLLIISPNGARPTVDWELSLAELRDIHSDNRVGSQALCVTSNGEEVELLRYTSAEAPRFGKVRQRLDAWRDGEDTAAAEEAERAVEAEQTEKRVTPKAALRLFRYLKPFVSWIVLLAGLVVASDMLGLIGPLFHGLLIDHVLVPGGRDSGQAQRAAEWIGWMVTADTRYGMLSQIIAYLLVFQFVGVVLSVSRGRISSWLGYEVVHNIRAELVGHLSSLTLRYFDGHQTGAVMSRVTQDTRAMQQFLVDEAQHLATNVFKLFAIGAILLKLNWQLALLTLLPAPAVAFFATAFIKKMRLLYGRLWQSWERLSAALQDSVSGIRVVKAFAGETRETNRFIVESRLVADAGTAANKLQVSIFPWIGFSIHLSTLVIWFFGGRRVIDNTMSIGDIFVFLSYLFMFYGPMEYLSGLFNRFNQALAAAERVWEVLDEHPDVPEPVDPIHLERVEGRFTLEDVTFGYEPHEPVLHDLNLDVQPGEMIGLVGHSGAGKSTFINLICRFYDVDQGSIKVDGIDIRQLSGETYRRNIGVVLQDNFLFSGSVAENIAYGQQNASMEQIIAAARAANAHDFIVRFPDGYDTLVGERGTRLSGGERQRISIARAILHNPRILILDEATASVDTETEQRIQQALERLVQGRTTFAIAHRLSTLRHADRLVVLERGRIAEVGTHDELLAKEGGVYRKLVEMQASMNSVKHIGG